jgi:hypothetical protein
MQDWLQNEGVGDDLGAGFAATFATITAVVVAFRYAVVYLDILPKNPPPQRLDGGDSASRSVSSHRFRLAAPDKPFGAFFRARFDRGRFEGWARPSY